MTTRNRFAVAACVLGGILLLAGCLSVPLGDPEKSTVDDKLLGWWQFKAPDATADSAAILVQKYDSRSYLIWYYSYTPDGNSIKTKGALTFKAWLTPIADAQFLTLKTMSPSEDLHADKEKERYSVMRVEKVDGGLQMRSVNDEFVKDCTTSDALLKKVTDNVNNDALYNSQKSPLFTHPSDAEMDNIGKVIAAFMPADK